MSRQCQMNKKKTKKIFGASKQSKNDRHNLLNYGRLKKETFFSCANKKIVGKYPNLQ